jgi:hypothetical protein
MNAFPAAVQILDEPTAKLPSEPGDGAGSTPRLVSPQSDGGHHSAILCESAWVPQRGQDRPVLAGVSVDYG